MKTIYEKIKLLDSKIKSNPNLIILIIFFNCAMLMDLHDFYKVNPYIFGLLLIPIVLNIISIKYWYSLLFIGGFSFFYFLYRFPRQANHANLELFVMIFILIVLLYFLISKKNQNILPSVQLIFKVSTICIYFFAGFFKLNSGFFNADLSCIAEVSNQIIYNFFGSGFKLSVNNIRFFQISSLIIELIIPFGLLFKRFQKPTILILICFHIILCLSIYADFSAFAGFLILVSTINLNQKLPCVNTIVLKIYMAFVLISILIESVLYKLNMNLSAYNFYAGIIFSIGLFYFFINYLKKRTISHESISTKKTIIISSCCFLFFSFWSLKAFLGFGNLANLTMFSNLITEKKHSNHYLIDTKYTKVFNFEEDNLQIISLHDTLKYVNLEGYKLPVIEFKYKTTTWVKRYNNLKLNATVVYKNDTLVIKNLKESEFNDSKWYYKYVYFRKIQVDGNPECLW